MAKRSPKPRDLNQRAAAIVAEATSEDHESAPQKDAAAVERGRRGGEEHARRLSPERRREIARNARAARSAREQH